MQILMDNGFCFVHHLTFRDPEGSLGNCNGKIVDLYAIELTYSYLNWVETALSEYDLITVNRAECLIFQFAKFDIGLREKISRAAGEVKKRQGRQLFSELFQSCAPCFFCFQFENARCSAYRRSDVFRDSGCFQRPRRKW